MITRLAIKNFKSIGEAGVDLELKPLTILLGPNGSGKSSILEAAAILKESIKVGEGLRFSDGELVSYPSIDSIAHRSELHRWITIEIHVQLDEFEIKQFKERESAINKAGLGVHIKQENSIGHRYSYKPETGEAHQSIVVGHEEVVRASYLQVDKKSYQPQFTYPPGLGVARPHENPTLVFRSRVFRQVEHVVEQARPLTDMAQAATEIIPSKLENKLFYISALRGQVDHQVGTQPHPTWVGKHGEYLIHMLSLIFAPREYEKIEEKIKEWANRFDLLDPGAGWRGGNILSADYEDPELKTALNLAMAGHGSRQIMSIITQLFWSKADDVIMIEEPEISLHPNSQALLPDLFAAATNEGKQVIITTHSEFLPLALRRPVANGLLKPEHIAVYHIEKKSEGTLAERLEVTKEGYVKGWIPSFAEIESQLLKEWARTLTEE